LKGPVQDFINGVVELKNAVVDFCAGVVGLFAQAKPMLNPSVDGKKEFSGEEFVKGDLFTKAFLAPADE
jgi:hypothetical protein